MKRNRDYACKTCRKEMITFCFSLSGSLYIVDIRTTSIPLQRSIGYFINNIPVVPASVELYTVVLASVVTAITIMEYE